MMMMMILASVEHFHSTKTRRFLIRSRMQHLCFHRTHGRKSRQKVGFCFTLTLLQLPPSHINLFPYHFISSTDTRKPPSLSVARHWQGLGAPLISSACHDIPLLPVELYKYLITLLVTNFIMIS